MGVGSSSLVRRRKKKKGDKDVSKEIWRRHSAVEPRKMASAVVKSDLDRMDIQIWLSILGLSKYHGAFSRFRGVEDLFDFRESDLKSLGVRNSDDRDKIMASLRNLRERNKNGAKLKKSGSSTSLNSVRSLVNIPPGNAESCADYEELNPIPTAITGKRILSQSSIRKSREEDVMDPQHIKKMLEWELSLDSDDLRSHAWYHGSIPRSHAERILLHDEEFLVRDCGSKPGSFVLSCRARHAYFHFVINKVLVQHGTIYERVQYQFEEDSFDSVAGLITYYVGSGKPVSTATGARIRHPRNRLYPLTYFPNQLTNPDVSSTAGSPRSSFTRSSPSIFASVRGCRSAAASRSGSTSYSPSAVNGGNHSTEFFGGGAPSVASSSRAASSATLLRRPSPSSAAGRHLQQHQSQTKSTDALDDRRSPSVMGQQVSCASGNRSSTPVTPPPPSVLAGVGDNFNHNNNNKSESDLLMGRSADHVQRQRQQRLSVGSNGAAGSKSLPRIRSRTATAGGDAVDGSKGPSQQNVNGEEPIVVEADGEKVALRRRSASRTSSRPPPLVGTSNADTVSFAERNFFRDLEKVVGDSVPCSPGAVTHVEAVVGPTASLSPSTTTTTAVTGFNRQRGEQRVPSTDADVDDDDIPDYDVPPPPVAAAAASSSTPTPSVVTLRPTSAGGVSSSSPSSSSSSASCKTSTLRWTHRSSGSDSGINSGESMTSGESTTSELPVVLTSPTSSAAPTLMGSTTRRQMAEEEFVLPCQTPPSAFDVENFQSLHFSAVHETKPLDRDVWASVRKTLLERPPKVLAAHLTAIDLDLMRIVGDADLGFGITSGVELLMLPDGKQLRCDVIERVNCLSLFVSASILQGEDDKRRSEMIHLWIQVADELKSSMGNLLGFAAVMLGIDSRPVQRLSSTWYKVRQTYTDSAHKFEARLRAAFKSMNDSFRFDASPSSSSPNVAPNTCVPYVLPLCAVMDMTPEALAAAADQDQQPAPSSAAPVWDPCAKDRTLAHLVAQIEEGLRFAASVAAYRRNGARILAEADSASDVLVADVFRTEFHLTYLWGSSGATADQSERYVKFRRVLDALSRRCERDGDYA